jgi:alpha-tubulin suppressor-like RCC1 family protein
LLSLPPTVPKATKIKQIVSGRHFALALPEYGNGVFGWGANHFGQLGTSTVPDEIIEIGSKVVINTSKKLVFSDKLVHIESRLFADVDGQESPIVSIAAGDFHALALTATGKVWAWGCNRNYQCGADFKTVYSNASKDSGAKPSIVTTLANSYGDVNKSKLATAVVIPKLVLLPNGVTQIAAGGSHSVAIISETNEVYCWGKNQYGQCGNSDVYTNGLNPQAVKALTGIEMAQVSAGGNHTIALAKNGQVLSWGDHTQGQLGILNGSTIGCLTQSKPRRVQELENDDIRKRNSSSEVYLSCSDMSGSSPPQSPVSTDNESVRQQTNADRKHQISKIVSVYAGRNYSAAICESGYVYVWGSNDCGQLGIPTPKDSKDIPMIREGSRIPCLPRKLNNRRSSKLPQSVMTSRNRQVTSKRQAVRNVQTFDSEHNILLPMHLDAVSHVHTRSLACGPTHMWIVGEARISPDNRPSSSFAKTPVHPENVLVKGSNDTKSILYNENIDVKNMQTTIL